jgi:hypothetical protein
MQLREKLKRLLYHQSHLTEPARSKRKKLDYREWKYEKKKT